METVYIPDADTGVLIEAQKCVPLHPEAPDPYASWDDESLAGVAYSDARAAETLGLRQIRSNIPEREGFGLAMLYRSVALSGDPQTFRKAIGLRYGHTEINGVPQIHNLKQQLLFNIIGRTLGDSGFNPALVQSALLRAQVSKADVHSLHEQARAILDQMASLQTELTGEVSIREALENA